MVRETRHLWVGNLPDDIREEKLVEHFARYGRVESAKLTGKRDADGSQSAFVDFVDINSATKAHDASVITIGERDLQIEYNNPDSPTEIHPGESSREYELPGRIPRYENRRGGTVEDRYDPAGPTYEFDRSYGQHYGRENSQYRDESSSSPAYRERQRERTRANFYNSHSRSSDQYENDPDYLKDSYGENFGDASLRKSRLKPFKTLPGQSKSPSARSGSGSGRKSKSNSRSRSRSRSKSTDSHSSDTGSEDWSPRSRSRDRESDRESRNTETTQSSLGGSSKFAGLCVRNLPARSSDSSIKDGLFHEFKKYGQVTAVTVQGVGEDRKGIVFFKRAEDMEKAMEASRGNSFFGCEMALSVWDGADLGVDDSEVKYFEKELDEFHPRATRTLFVGNLDRSVTREDLNEAFHKFGEIVHIEIKKPAGAQPFAFLQFSDIDSVVRARKKLDGEYVGKNKVKLGFGKSMATNCVWLDNLSQKVTEKYLMQFCGLRFGEVTRVVHDRRTNMALVFFINIDDSQKAVQDLKIGSIMGRRPKVDFASRECQNHFYDRMEQTGQAAYYNHSGETSPGCPTYPERKFTPKNSSGDFRGSYNSSSPFEPRRASRAQSSGGGFPNKYSSGSYEERYPYGREEGYHERHYSNKDYSSIRSSSYDGDDYQQELLEYGYHQKERTKEQFRDKSRSSSPSCRERSGDGRQKSMSVEPADDAVSPLGSVEDAPSRSPSPKRKWKGNTLMVQNSKEGSSTPMPKSPSSEEGQPEEPSWKNRNGNSSSERGSTLDQTDLPRKAKSKLLLDIPRDEDLIGRKKKVTPKLLVDKSSSPYLERTKGDSSLLGDSDVDRMREPLEGDKDPWVDKFKDKKSPRSDFLLDKPPLKRGLDMNESAPSLQHDLDSSKRWQDEELTVDSVNDTSSVGDLQKKLEARKQRFSDNSPVDIQKLRKERYFPATSSSVPKLGKGNLRDSEYIPKGDSFLGDSRTVEDSHMSQKEGVLDPSDNSNGGHPCKHNDRIDSFWWMPKQKVYSDDEKGEKSTEAAADVTLQPQQPCSSETATDGGTTQAALNKPKKSVPDNSNLSQDRTRKRHKGRIPHISNDMDEGIASSSDQETPGSEEELGLKPFNSHSAHSNALQGIQGSDNLHTVAAAAKSTTTDSFDKPPQLDSKLTYRKQVENPRSKPFDVKPQVRQRHPSVGEGLQGLEGKKGMDEKGRLHNSRRKEQQGTVIQEMEWKMIPLDPITFPPSGRKEQIDAIFFGSENEVNHPTEGSVESTKSGLKTDTKAAGSLSSDLNNIVSDQYCNPLSLITVESENIRNDTDQLPLLSPKPGTTKVGNTASPPTSAPPHLSPAVTPLKTKEDIQADLAKVNVTKLIGEPLHPKPNPSILDSRNCQKAMFPERDIKEKAILSSSTLSSLNEKSSYLRPGEEKVNSWLRQIPSPTLPVTLESTGEPRDQRSFLLIGSNNGSPSLSVTPSTPSTPSTPNDGRLGEMLSTKTRVERLSNCRIVKKNRNSVDVDSRTDKKAANDELIKYFQDRMQQNSIFSLDEARLNSDQSKLRVAGTTSISTSGSLLAKSRSEDVSPAEGVKLNRSNSDPRMAAGSKLLSLPKTIDSSAASMPQVASTTSASLGSGHEKDQDAVATNETSSATAEVGKEDGETGRGSVDLGMKWSTPTEVTKDSLTTPPLQVIKEIPKLKSILKKRTESIDDLEEDDDVGRHLELSKEIGQGIKRKRSPSPVSGEVKKVSGHTGSVDPPEKKTEDSTVPSTPKFQHPTNMLLHTPNERTKKLVVKPRSKPKADKVLPVTTKTMTEKALIVKKETSTVKKEVSTSIGEMVKSKSAMKEKSSVKSNGKKVEKKEERKMPAEKKVDNKKAGEKKIEKKHLEKKNSMERKEEKKSSEKQETKGEEKISERKFEDVKDWKKEEKKTEKKEEKKATERKVEKRSDEKKQSEKKLDEKKSVKKFDEKKVSKDGKVEDKRGSERKLLEKKVSEKKGEDKRAGDKKVEEKKFEKRGDEKKMIDRKGDEKKIPEKKSDEKKIDKKEERKVEERKVAEKKVSEKKPQEKKGDKKGVAPVTAEKRKPEKVSEKLKETKSSEKTVPKKSEEKLSENKPIEREKIEKSKSKSSKKLQKADSTEGKMKRPVVKDTLKVRSKTEDKTKGKSPQTSPEKSTPQAKKVSKKVSGGVSNAVVNDGTGFGPGGSGGGVRALMHMYADSDSSGSDEEDFEIFHQAASSKTPKTPALKKNVIFSSSDESDSETTTERRNPNQVLQKLFDRESFSDSDFDDKPSPSLSLSPEVEESHSHKPVKRKGRPLPEKLSSRQKTEKEKSIEAKRSKVEKESKEVEKAVKRNEIIEPAEVKEVKKGQDTKKSSPSKKTEAKSENRSKDKSGRNRSRKEGKESKSSKVEDTEETVELPVSKSKAKKRETEMEKMHSRGKKMEVFDDSLSESFDEPTTEQEEEVKPMPAPEPEVKVPKGKLSKKSGKSRDKTKKEKSKTRQELVEKQVVSKDGPELDSWTESMEEEAESKVEIELSTPNLEEVPEVKEPEPEPEPEPTPDIKAGDDGMTDALDNPPVQEYETEEVVEEKVTKEEEIPVSSVSTKATKGKQKKKKVKHRQTKKSKKEPLPPPLPEGSAPVIPEITVSSESVETVKPVVERAAEKEPKIPEGTDSEMVVKSEPAIEEMPGVEETNEMLDECTDAEKAAAMFEETAEATAALELVEIDEQQRQRELAEEIFGESTPTAPSPAAPPTPSPMLPSPRPMSPRLSSPELPDASHTDEVSNASEAKMPEVVSGIKEEGEEDSEIVKHEKPSPSVHHEEVEEKVVKTEKEEMNNLTDKICDDTKTEIEHPKIDSLSAVDVKQEIAEKVEDDVRVKIEAVPDKPDQNLDVLEETVHSEEPEIVSAEAAAVEIPLHEGSGGDEVEPKSSLQEDSILNEVKVTPTLPESDVSETVGLKLEDVPVKLGDCSQELKSEDLEGAEETASVEVTTETASEANDSFVIAESSEVLDVPPVLEVREKLPTTPTHKGKKKKRKKHRDKKNAKKEGRKGDKEKKKKRKKSKSSREGKRKRQKTSHKSGRHRSLSSSSYHDDMRMESHKSMERIPEQASSASMETIVHPSGLPIHKIENQQAVFYSPDQRWHPGMDGMGNNFYQIPASMPGFPPSMQPMFNQSMAQMERGYMKPTMVNSNLVPNEGNTSPIQPIRADDMSLKMVGVNENIKLINFGGMKVETRGQVPVAGMLSPSGSDDKTKKRHPSGKSGIVEHPSLPHSGGGSKVEGQTLEQMQHTTSSGQAVMVKEELEERREGALNKSQQLADLTAPGSMVGKEATQEGYSDGASESENTKVSMKELPQKGGDGTVEERSQEGDVYDFNEEEPSMAGAADQTRIGQSQKNASLDVYEFQESPGPSSSKASPSKLASAHRAKQKSRTRGGGRTRSNSRGSTKEVKIKEEGQESGGVEEAKKVDSQSAYPSKMEEEADSLPKGAVAELVPSSEGKVVAKSEETGMLHPMPLGLPNTNVLAGLLPIGSISQADKQSIYAADPHVRMMANVSAAQTSMATALQNKSGNGRMMPCHNSALAPSVSMPAVVAALNNNPANAKQHPHMDIRNTVSQAPVMTTGSRKQSVRKRNEKKVASQYQPQYTQPPHPQQIRNIPSTQSQVAAVELHFKESLMRNQRQNMVHKTPSSLPTVQIPPGQPVAVITSQPGIIPAMITPTGTSSGSASREAPAITSQLIGVGTHSYGNRSPAMAEGMKSGPHTVASVPESQTSPDTSLPGVTRSGMHPNLPSTLVSVPTPTPSKRQQGVINTKYECRVPTSVAATSYPDASVLRARLTQQNEPKLRGAEDGKLLSADGQVPGAFLHPSNFVEKPGGHGDEKADPIKPGDRNVPTEQRLPAAYHPDGHMVYYNPRPDGHPVIRGPGPVGIPAMFPDPTAAGLQGLPIPPGLVHPGMDMSKGLPHHGGYGIAYPGPFPPRLFHPSLVHGDQNQPLASPRALASPRMVVPNTSSPRLSPKIKSPGLGHGDRTAQTPDKQAEHHNVVLRPGITTGIPPPGPEHPEMHNLPHRGLPQMMPQPAQLPKTERDLDKAPEDCRHHQGPGQHGIPPHIQQLPAQNIPEHTRTTPGPHPERGSPGSHTPGTRTPGQDGRQQQVILQNSSTMKQWPPPGISPHTPIVRGSHPASPIPSMGGEASVMLYMRYPVMWQGMLALKQEIATIQLHYICGNKVVATDALKMAYPPLRIAQRMRLEDSQLDGVARRMQVSEESVVLLALPCGSDQDEILNQTSAMRAGLISYLKEKQAAGIINVGPPGCTDPSYVIHIFPPCEFTERSLHLKAPDLLESVMNVAYMMFVIATC